MRNNDKVVRKLPQDMNQEELRTLRKVVSEMNNINPAQIKFCRHSQERLQERNISREAVNEIYKYAKLENVVEKKKVDIYGLHLDFNTSDKVAENGLAEFLYVTKWVNPLKSIFIFSKSSEASPST